MTLSNLGALAILILIFATGSIVFFVKNILDKNNFSEKTNIPEISPDDYYVIKEKTPSHSVKPKTKYTVVNSKDVYEMNNVKERDSA